MSEDPGMAKKDHIQTIAYSAGMIVIIAVSGLLLIGDFITDKFEVLRLIIWMIIVNGGLFLFVKWHAKIFAYVCPNCGNKFEISPFMDFISPQFPPDKKCLKCPDCRKRAWMREVSKN